MTEWSLICLFELIIQQCQDLLGFFVDLFASDSDSTIAIAFVLFLLRVEDGLLDCRIVDVCLSPFCRQASSSACIRIEVVDLTLYCLSPQPVAESHRFSCLVSQL
jgi:hypothetical protein